MKAAQHGGAGDENAIWGQGAPPPCPGCAQTLEATLPLKSTTPPHPPTFFLHPAAPHPQPAAIWCLHTGPQTHAACAQLQFSSSGSLRSAWKIHCVWILVGLNVSIQILVNLVFRVGGVGGIGALSLTSNQILLGAESTS